jgi:hypothetical protein
LGLPAGAHQQLALRRIVKNVIKTVKKKITDVVLLFEKFL